MVEVHRRRGRKPAGPYILTDSLTPHWNHAANKMVDSRTEHKRILREKGWEEVGNEWDGLMEKGIQDYEPTTDDIPNDVYDDLSRGLT